MRHPVYNFSQQFSSDSSSSADGHKTLGALDMGGASSEITFIPNDPSSIAPGYRQKIQLRGVEYAVYSHSYPCFGLNEAYRRYLARLVQVTLRCFIPGPKIVCFPTQNVQ